MWTVLGKRELDAMNAFACEITDWSKKSKVRRNGRSGCDQGKRK